MEHKPANNTETQHTWITFSFLQQVSCLFQGKSSAYDAADPFSAVDIGKGRSSQPFAPPRPFPLPTSAESLSRLKTLSVLHWGQRCHTSTHSSVEL
jgi:hypothetical protein